MKFPLYYQDSGNILWYGLQHITPIWKVLIGAFLITACVTNYTTFWKVYPVMSDAHLNYRNVDIIRWKYSLPARFANDRSENHPRMRVECPVSKFLKFKSPILRSGL